jgi:hypothetical protein
MGCSGIHRGAEEGMYLERSGHLLRLYHRQLSCTQTTEYSVLLHRSVLSIPAGAAPAKRLLQLCIVVVAAAIAIAKMSGGAYHAADIGVGEERAGHLLRLFQSQFSCARASEYSVVKLHNCSFSFMWTPSPIRGHARPDRSGAHKPLNSVVVVCGAAIAIAEMQGCGLHSCAEKGMKLERASYQFGLLDGQRASAQAAEHPVVLMI